MHRQNPNAVVESDDDDNITLKERFTRFCQQDEKVDEDEEMASPAKAIGEPVKVSGKGNKRIEHYAKFEYDGSDYGLNDTVLLTPEDPNSKPYVAIIKDITSDFHNRISITGQWFYRPEEAMREDGCFWETRDNRVLYYSAHVDVVAAETVMHTCVIHVIPINKKFPVRFDNPGFIVQKFYNTMTKELSVLPEDRNMSILRRRTFERLGELPDVDDVPSSPVVSVSKKRNLTPSSVTKADRLSNGTGQVKGDKKQGCNQTDISFYLTILKNSKALMGVDYRDWWLGTLLQEIEATCTSINTTMVDDTNDGAGNVPDKIVKSSNQSGASTDLKYNGPSAGEGILWPNAAIKAITSLERAVHDAHNGDLMKYNQKLRALRFNLKKSSTLAKRLLNKELDPVVIVNMSPDELKMGFTVEEGEYEEPKNAKQIQMTNNRCVGCSEKKVGIADIINGVRWDRY